MYGFNHKDNPYKADFYETTQFDLALDTTRGILKDLERHAKRGTIHTNNKHMYAYGNLDREDFHGPVGRQSKFYRELNTKELPFELTTLYLGTNRGMARSGKKSSDEKTQLPGRIYYLLIEPLCMYKVTSSR